MNLLIPSFLLLLMFILAGFNKLLNLEQTTNYLKNKINLRLPYFIYLVIILFVIIIQLGCSFHILYSIYNKTYINIDISIYSIICFTILATLIFHFPPIGKDYYSFLSNLSTIGGLLLLSQYIKKNI
jgi:uncharacterized membrane protein YphA (DoxX/SURF4 family)